ncbi:class I SAM-dependent methyltransferase [Lichenicoccus sp.]|uniref:class I SAM-dependent methyltransferase n=1 Tax=Lichenicoccus sp. TaxID=2781899 RepID=UPI003D14A41D
MPEQAAGADAADRELAAQYEAYPYPARDPRDEHRRLIVGSPSHLREIDHWVFGAQRSRARPLRALVAGCGTGDGAIMLAQQMVQAGRPGHVLCLDRSRAALEIARARAEARGLPNIDFREASLLQVAGLGLGPFDYIDCCGVLHHLPEPARTLRDLAGLLAKGGGIGLMLYAPHGRTGVYMLQDALALLAPGDAPPALRLDVARRVLRHLPRSAWLHANRNFADHLSGGDAGLYDLLLNPRDRAYDVPALRALVAEAGLSIGCLLEPARYEPSLLLPDPRLRARLEAMPLLDRAAVAEGLLGNMNTHIAYVRRPGAHPPEPDPLAPDAVPVAREVPAGEIARQIGPDGSLPHLFGQLAVRVPLPPQARALLGLIDGERTVAAIAAGMRERGLAPARIEAAWRETIVPLIRLNRVLLAAPA